jgi:hypothetical protein
VQSSHRLRHHLFQPPCQQFRRAVTGGSPILKLLDWFVFGVRLTIRKADGWNHGKPKTLSNQIGSADIAYLIG